ncbi:MAG: hypothetical protein K8953_13235, partial [Proteobacteria bacterium]|nr:hypothetical protein [Pseudomonadota bacterium]
DKDAAQDSAAYKSGVALFAGDIINTASEAESHQGIDFSRQYYVGLLSGTTVGKNLLYRTTYTVGEESVASAIWGGVISGRFGAHSTTDLGGGIPNHTKGVTGITIDDKDILNDLGQVVRKRTFFVTDRNFQLEINFEFSTIKTPAGARTGAFHSVDLRFDGRFDRNGIMSGTVDVAPQIKPGGDIPDGSTNRNNHGPGRFTGIIGETAAIGVFKADRGSTGTGNAGYVGGFIATPCGFDLSNPTCLKDDVAVTTAYCTNLTANKGTNPFNVGCNDEVGIESIRANACVKNEDIDTAEVSRCPDLIVGFCLDAPSDTGSNPFNAVCARFEGVQPHTANLSIARNNACLAFGTAADLDCSNRSNVLTKCTRANPYAYVGCNTVIESHISNADRRAYCMTADGLAHPACPNANSGKWLASFTDDEELTINPNTISPTNEFLQIEGNTISIAETTTEANDVGGDPTP